MERPVHGIEPAQGFRHPLAQVFGIDLERHVAANIDGPQVDRRQAVAHPFRQHQADASGRLDADGIETGGDEQAIQPRSLAQMIAVVRRETFRATEKSLNTGVLQGRHPMQRHFQNRLEVI